METTKFHCRRDGDNIGDLAGDLLYPLCFEGGLVISMQGKTTQNWVAYNKAKTNEKQLFFKLLRELIDEVYLPGEERRKGAGRPRFSFNDMLFACCIREYCCFSSRKTMSELKLAVDLGLIEKAPHFNTITNFLKDKSLYEELQKLIIISALPLKNVETNISIDATGFSVSPYDCWNEERWGNKNRVKWYDKYQYERSKDQKGSNKYRPKGWLKAHFAVGTNTHIICSAEVTKKNVGDSTMFTPLVLSFSKYFDAKELSADKAYSSKQNLELALKNGVFPYIPFKDNTNPKRRKCLIWSMLYYYFKTNVEIFEKHYHRRSNVETVNFMIKNRLGSKIKAKQIVQQKNELLCRFLVHNITVLIEEICEYHFDVNFMRAVKDFAQKCR